MTEMVLRQSLHCPRWGTKTDAHVGAVCMASVNMCDVIYKEVLDGCFGGLLKRTTLKL